MTYQPDSYWSRRLGQNFNLRGTGHLAYDERYNRWLYRAKRDALRAALKDVQPDQRALDVGSGVGWVVAELLSLGLRADGCDISEEAVNRLQERFPEFEFFEFSFGAEPIPRESDSYDFVTMLDVAYHVVDDRLWTAGLAEIKRVLRPGGRLVVSDGLDEHDVVPAEHVRFRSLSRWRSETDSLGLRITEVSPYFRWLSRDRDIRAFRRLPDGLRGAVEYGLERMVPRRPHMRCATIEKPGPESWQSV